MMKYILAILFFLLLAVPASAQVPKGYPQMCTDNATPGVAATTEYLTCEQMRAGTSVSSPSFQIIRDWDSTLRMDVIRLNDIRHGITGKYNGAMGVNALITYDPTAAYDWYPAMSIVATDAMVNNLLRGVEVLSLNTGLIEGTANWARFRLDANYNLLTSINDPLGQGTEAGGVRVAPPTDAYFMVSPTTAANTAANPFYHAITNGTNVADVLAAYADNLALTLNPVMVGSVDLLYDGATLDMARASATGGKVISVEDWPDAYDDANGWVETLKSETGTTAPAKTAGTAVDETGGGDTGDVVLGPIECLDDPNWTVTIKNAAGGSGDDLSDAIILVSPSGAAGEWESLTWTACDTLGDGDGTCSFSCSNCSYRYVQVEALCGASDDTTVDAWYTANEN